MERTSKRAVGFQIYGVDQLPEIHKPNSHHRPVNLRLYINGDRYFPGKKININPGRYSNFNEFLSDVTGRLAPGVKLPHGVRQIFTPVNGRRIFDINDLSEGEVYVCAGFEGFKMMKYGRSQLPPWSIGQNWGNSVLQREQAPEFHASFQYQGYASYAFHPGRYFHASQPTQLHRWPGMLGTNQRENQNISKSNNIPKKPRVITVVRNGIKPRPSVKILLNPQAIQSYEQLLADISGAFSPHWKNSNIQRLFTVHGKEVLGTSDFFRGDDIFIGQGSGEPNLKKHEIAGILEELFPDSNFVKLLLRDWRKNQRNMKNSYHASWDRTVKVDSNVLAADQITSINCSVQEKRDSGFDSGDSNMNWAESEHSERLRILRPRKRLGRKLGRESEKEERKVGNNYHDVASSVDRSAYGHMQIDLARQTETRKDEDTANDLARQTETKKDEDTAKDLARQTETRKDEDTAKENVRSQKEKIHTVYMKKINDVDKVKGLIPLNERSNNFKQSDESLVTKDRKLIKETEKMKEQQQLEMERFHQEKEDRENAEKAARERMAEAEKEKHEEETSEKELLKKSTRETHTVECNPREHGIETGKLKAQRGSELCLQNAPDAFDVNLSVGTSVNQKSLSVKESTYRDKAQRVETWTTTQANDQKDSRQSKTHPKQGPEETQERKRRKSKVVHKTKEERQVNSDDFVTSQYELGRKLGDGNFANVYQSRKLGTGQEFAVKVIDKSKLRGKEYMVENEISIMKDCRHHNIVRLYEEFETPSWIYLIMELVKGGDLFDAISQSVKFAEADSAVMVKDLCQALFYLHSRRIVHRDIKPENLLVYRNKDGSVTLKLADFGLAMEVKELIYTVCGTPTYVAPEILNETGYGLEVDMWAVGVITYILLCGFPPFRSAERKQSELFESIKAGQFEFLYPFWDDASRSAKDLISHLLVVDKRKRYTAIDALSHMWIVCKGQTEIVPDVPLFVDGLDVHARQGLEEKARLNNQAYQILTEKKRHKRN